MDVYPASPGWSPTNPRPRMVVTAMDGCLPFVGWSGTNPRMVTHEKEMYYGLGFWHFDLTHKTTLLML